MRELKASLEALESRWLSQGIPMTSSSDATVAKTRIKTTGKHVSNDVIQLYSTIGGMLNSHMDDTYFSLWPLEQAITRNLKIKRNEWFFGDHLIDLFFYAFSFRSEDQSAVIQMQSNNDNDPFTLAETAEDFFTRYADAETEDERFRAVL